VGFEKKVVKIGQTERTFEFGDIITKTAAARAPLRHDQRS